MSGPLALSVLFTVFSPPVGPVFRLLLGMGGGNSEAETFKSTACKADLCFLTRTWLVISFHCFNFPRTNKNFPVGLKGVDPGVLFPCVNKARSGSILL